MEKRIATKNLYITAACLGIISLISIITIFSFIIGLMCLDYTLDNETIISNNNDCVFNASRVNNGNIICIKNDTVFDNMYICIRANDGIFCDLHY